MTRFIPLIDNNNKTVLQWTMVDSNGVETVKSVPKSLWKPEKDWSEQEVHSFFETDTVEITIVDSEDEDLEDRVEELEDSIEELKEHIEKKSFLNDS